MAHFPFAAYNFPRTKQYSFLFDTSPPRISTQPLSFLLQFLLSFIFLNFIIAKYARYERSFQKYNLTPVPSTSSIMIGHRMADDTASSSILVSGVERFLAFRSQRARVTRLPIRSANPPRRGSFRILIANTFPRPRFGLDYYPAMVILEVCNPPLASSRMIMIDILVWRTGLITRDISRTIIDDVMMIFRIAEL